MSETAHRIKYYLVTAVKMSPTILNKVDVAAFPMTMGFEVEVAVDSDSIGKSTEAIYDDFLSQYDRPSEQNFSKISVLSTT